MNVITFSGGHSRKTVLMAAGRRPHPVFNMVVYNRSTKFPPCLGSFVQSPFGATVRRPWAECKAVPRRKREISKGLGLAVEIFIFRVFQRAACLLPILRYRLKEGERRQVHRKGTCFFVMEPLNFLSYRKWWLYTIKIARGSSGGSMEDCW